MASTSFDSILFRDFFGTEAMRRVFSDDALIARYLAVEASSTERPGRRAK